MTIIITVGAGQTGLMVAARLQRLGVPTLVIEKTPRVGDVWRKRWDPYKHSWCEV